MNQVSLVPFGTVMVLPVVVAEVANPLKRYDGVAAAEPAQARKAMATTRAVALSRRSGLPAPRPRSTTRRAAAPGSRWAPASA